MARPLDDMPYEQVKIEKLKHSINLAVAECQLTDFSVQELKHYADYSILQLKAAVWAEEKEKSYKDLHTPATWWDQLKLNHFPRWFLRRFPVRTKTTRVHFVRQATYPRLQLLLPQDETYIAVMKEKYVVEALDG